ncbi:MAG: response regulator transcription factor [Planctomycetales bacterium]|nr:response regulator transcription factor [Planctomycetales bacterium]
MTEDFYGSRKKIAIVDDHPLVREAIARAISNESDLEMCGSVGDVEEAMDLVRRQKLDLILIDISLHQSSGFVLLDTLKQRFPDLPAIVLSMHEETTHAARAIRCGARGYVMKKERLETIIRAIRHVLSGNIWFKEESIRQALKDHRVKPQSIPNLLTQRELEIFEMIGNGTPVDVIAKQLFISKRTVESHRDHIKVKLNVSDILHLHQLAYQWIHEKRI